MKQPFTRAFFFLVSFCLSFATISADGLQQKVRVGWYESDFNHTDQHGRLSGYAYEYQLRIAANTDWEYEYVKGSWVDLFEQLESGEIDILSDVSYTDERALKMLFSEHAMGYEEYYLIALNTDTTILSSDLSTINGKRIGVNRNSYQAGLLRQWLKNNHLQAQIMEFDGMEADYLTHLLSEKIDILATNTAFSSIGFNNCHPIARLGAADYFFAINKKRPDLKEELDRAMRSILDNNSFYNRDLTNKYFTRSSFFQYMPDSERNWLDQHGPIRIGYRDNYLPFCSQNPETGKVTGLLGDFINRIETMPGNINIKFEAIAYPTINEAIDAVIKGEIDVVFPNGMSAYDTERTGLLSIDAFVKSAEMAVVRQNDYFHANGKVRAAINASNPNYISLIRDQYPEWQIVHFPTTNDCLRGVSEGKADLLLISNYRLGILNETLEEMNLKVVATGSVIPLTFATGKHQRLLYSIMTQLSHLLSDTEKHASLAKHSEIKQTTTFSHFAKNNARIVVPSLIGIIALITLLLWRNHHEHKHALAANLAKSRFLFNMSHDIRTPMNAIMGYTELMQKNLNDKEKCQHYLNRLHDSGEFLLNLINHVLEMARIESGKTVLTETPHILGETLSTLHHLYEDLTDKKGIRLEMSTDIHTKCIYCDGLKVNEIFLNLLSNAYKYTPEGGTIRVNSKELPGPQEGYVTIVTTIQDTGMGMSKEFLPHIFEDFSREQTTTESKIRGTGLGMAIVKNYVDLMGGTVEVESELGKGTTFTVTLSHRIADNSLVETHEKATAITENNIGKRLLLAEDNELNAEIAIEILGAMGYQVDHADDGTVCIEMYEKAEYGTYAAILMDVQMPKLNGYEATRYIRHMKDKKKAAIPIIAMTSNAFEEDKKNATRAGMNAHLSKPIQVEQLLETLQAMI